MVSISNSDLYSGYWKLPGSLLHKSLFKTCFLTNNFLWGLPRWLSCNESACQAGDAASIPGSGRSSGGGSGGPLEYSGLGNPVDRGAWGLQSMGSQRVGHDLATDFHFFQLPLKTVSNLQVKSGYSYTGSFKSWLAPEKTCMLHSTRTLYQPKSDIRFMEYLEPPWYPNSQRCAC